MSQTAEQKLTEIINQGLVSGLGEAEPGKLCVEAAICLALGEPHSDKPSCVHMADRRLGMKINDSFKGTDAERAELLLPIALASLGTAGKDRAQWVKYIVEHTIRRVVPIALRKAGLTYQADRCEREGTKESADAANAAANAAAANAAANAAAANAAAKAAADCAANATATANAAAAATAATAYADAYAANAADAAAAAANATNAERNVWNVFQEIVLEAYALDLKGVGSA